MFEKLLSKSEELGILSGRQKYCTWQHITLMEETLLKYTAFIVERRITGI